MNQTTTHLPQNNPVVNLDKLELKVPEPNVIVNVEAPVVNVPPAQVTVNVPEQNIAVNIPETLVEVYPEVFGPDVFVEVDFKKIALPLYLIAGCGMIMTALKIIEMF